MEISIGKKIAQLRQDGKHTQERLAGHVGVSAAAVSKWETGLSYPDITLLPAIAEFFQVSVDALLDYKIARKAEALQKIYDKIQPYVNTSNYVKGLPIVEAALQKYPNDARLLQWAGFLTRCSLSEKDIDTPETCQKAIAYYERAALCETVPRYAILCRESIAGLYAQMKEYDKALEIYEALSAEGHQDLANDVNVAITKYHKGDFKGAKYQIQRLLWQSINLLYGVLNERLAGCYREEGNNEMALEAQKMHTAILSMFTNETPNFADFMCVESYLNTAECCLLLDYQDEMWFNLERAVYHAVRFDENPSFKIKNMKFMDGFDEKETTAVNLPYLACHRALYLAGEKFASIASDERYKALIAKLEKAKRTKNEAGIW